MTIFTISLSVHKYRYLIIIMIMIMIIAMIIIIMLMIMAIIIISIICLANLFSSWLDTMNNFHFFSNFKNFFYGHRLVVVVSNIFGILSVSLSLCAYSTLLDNFFLFNSKEKNSIQFNLKIVIKWTI